MKARIGILGLFFLWACGLDNTELGTKDSFIKFYDFGIGNKVEKTSDGGFICVGTYTGSSSWVHLIKTDEYGNAEWISRIEGYSGNDVKVLSNGGYIVIGDSIEVNNLTKLPAMALLKFTENGDLSGTPVLVDKDSVSGKSGEYHGQALTIDSNGDILALGTYTESGSSVEKMVLMNFSSSDLTMNWRKNYGVDTKNNGTGKSVQTNSTGQIIWNGDVFTGTNENIDSYIKVYTVKANSEPVNEVSKGELSTDNNFFAQDIQPIGNSFAIIGTKTATTGESFIYFAKVDQSGNIISSTEEDITDPAFIDDPNNVPTAANVEGVSLVRTNDSGVMLLGTRTSPITDNYGKGERDFLLIKIDNSGAMKWWKIIGGPGDEYGGSVIQTDMTTDDSGSFIIFGTSDFQGIPRMVLIKTTSKGVIN